jgi:DNA ligase-1
MHVQANLVAEIAFNEIQAGPRNPSGLAPRFARVKRYRPDKAAEADPCQMSSAFRKRPLPYAELAL